MKIYKKVIFSIVTVLSIGNLQAATLYDNGRKIELPNQIESGAVPQPRQDLLPPVATPDPYFGQPKTRKTLYIEPHNLLRHPKLLQVAMEVALQSQNMAAIKKLLPVYENFSQKNHELIAYARGLVAFTQQEYGLAEKYFAQVVKLDKHAQVALFYQAMSAYYNRDYYQANYLFSLVSQIKPLPDDVHRAVQDFTHNLHKLTKLNHWEELSVTYNPNINDAPPQKKVGRYTFDDPIKDWGLTYRLGLTKRFFLTNGWYLQPIISSQGTIYRHQHDYNIIDLSSSLGLGYADSKNDWRLSPNIFRRFYGGNAYSYDWGIDALWRHYWSGILDTTLSLSYDRTRYVNRQWLNSHTFQAALETQIQIQPRLSFSTGLRYVGLNGTRDADDSYDSLIYHFSLNKGWLNGLNTQLSSSLSWRNYHGAALFTNGQNKYENIYGISLSLWHAKLQWHGFAPKLVISQERMQGNNLINNYVRNKVVINIIKLF